MVKGRAHSLPGASAERLTSGLHHRMSSIPTQLLVYYGNKVYFTHWNTLNGYSVSCLAYFHLPLFLRTVPPRLKFLVGEDSPPHSYVVCAHAPRCSSPPVFLHYRDAVTVSRASPTSTCLCSCGPFRLVSSSSLAKSIPGRE